MADNQGLQSKKIHVTSSGKSSDGLSKLPDDTLLSIMSHLTMKEAAQIGTLSLKWRELWTYFPGIFNFEDPRIMRDWRLSLLDEALLNQYMSRFVSWVAQIVEQFRGSSIEEFKVACALDNTYQSQIDKWVAFALGKGAKSLVLNFSDILLVSPTASLYAPSLECFLSLKSLNLESRKPYLKVLNLNHINISTEVLECILLSCQCLENLSIWMSLCLTSIRALSSPLALKELKVTACTKLQDIDILAPRLLSFAYIGERINLRIRNASLLSEVSIRVSPMQPIAFALDSLSEYFSHLKYLSVMTDLHSQMNLALPPLPNLTNLKHLRLAISASSSQTLDGWIALIEASPALQKLTLELTILFGPGARCKLRKRDNARPLKCLKILELFGFVGGRIDVELANYVFENAVALEQVIIDFKNLKYDCILNDESLDVSMERADELRGKLPPGAELIIKK